MTVQFSEYVGGALHLHAPDHPAGRLSVRFPGLRASVGEVVTLGLAPERCHVFATDGRRLS